MATDVDIAAGWQDTDHACVARIVMDGSLITQAAITAISRTVYLELLQSDGGRTEAQAATAVTVATAVFDTLQTDGWWNQANGTAVDSTGYNFRDTIPASVFTAAGRVYKVRYAFTGASGQAFVVWFGIRTQRE